MDLVEPPAMIENRTFDEIEIAESASLTRTLSRDDIELFAVMSGQPDRHADHDHDRHAVSEPDDDVDRDTDADTDAPVAPAGGR
jgi:hypothetical protein